MESKMFRNAIFSQGQAPLTTLKTNVKAITIFMTPMETLAKMFTMITPSTAGDMTMMSSKPTLLAALAEEAVRNIIHFTASHRNHPSLFYLGIKKEA